MRRRFVLWGVLGVGVAVFLLGGVKVEIRSQLLDVLAKIEPRVFLTSLIDVPGDEPGFNLAQDFSGEVILDEEILEKADDFEVKEDFLEDESEALNREDLLDDIAEKLDIIRQEVEKLVALSEKDKKEEMGEEDKEEEEEEDKIYPKILISEVQVAGLSDEKQEFVELYNPNGEEVSLTGWFLQKKTASGQNWSSYASKNLFVGKKIPANGYFLIAREGFYGFADAFTDSSVTSDNSFALKWPNSEISDKLGFGNAADPESLPSGNPLAGQSVGRKFIDGSEKETDNNANDFELQVPTPKSQNITYSPPDIGGGGGGGTSYPKILISEVQVSPIGERFIELFNPNPQDVSLTGWYLQRKTETAESWSSLISSAKFEGKTISATGYFLISREIEGADILLDFALSENNSLVFKNPKKEVSDLLGYGNAKEFEIISEENPADGKSLGRKFNEENQNYTDTDNNSEDFEVNTPTPKAKNVPFVEAPEPLLVGIEITNLPEKLIYFAGEELDILGLEVIGNYEDGSTKIQEITIENITGFDSSAFVAEQVLTITVEGFTATFTVEIKEATDVTPPSGEITINEGAEYTNDRNVSLSVSATDDISGVVSMKIANGSYYYDWEPFALSKEWQLPATNGNKTVRIKFKDAMGNETATGIPATIILDTIAPIITLNGDSTVNLAVGDTYEELGAVVVDENIESSVALVGGDIVDTATYGTFQIFYDAVDLAGNNAVQVIRAVNVN